VIGVRVAAARTLLAVDSGHGTLGAEVDRARRDLPDERDRGLLLELTAGVYRWRAELDVCLAACCNRPFADIDPPLLATLRLALYQLRHLERIPVHAVVHESVDAARVLGTSRGAGFVNGILRNYLRTHAAIALPARPGPDATRRQQLAYLSVTLSHPRWLVARWLDRYGFDATERWCQFNNAPPDVTVRLRSKPSDIVEFLTAAGVPAVRGPYCRDVARLPPGVLGSMPDEVRRALFVQDEASVLVAHSAGAVPGERVLDLCAAPGGKSTVLWADMAGRGCLVAADARPNRIRLLRETLTASDVPPRIVLLDGTRPLPFGAVFDRVLVDAPCSGLGTLRRDPDLKWACTLDSLPGYAAVQRRILDAAAAVVRPGGTLVYATCSSEPDENDDVVAAFLSVRSDFAGHPFDGALADETGRLRTDPPRHGLDAFFAARLVRRESA